MSGADRPLTSLYKEDVLPRGSDFVFGLERKEATYMLSQYNGYERLSKGFLALTEISKDLISQFEFSELLGPVIKKTVSLVEQTENDSRVFWGQSLVMFRS